VASVKFCTSALFNDNPHNFQDCFSICHIIGRSCFQACIIFPIKYCGNFIYNFLGCLWGTHCSIGTANFRSLTLVSLLSLLQVFRILASGFTYSFYPCLRVFHETPTMQVANSQHATTIQHVSCCPLEQESSVAAYLERKSSVVAFLLVTFNSSGITMVAHILKVVSKYEERIRSL